jgi:hypothetical protein
MKFFRIKLLVIAVMLFAASSAFASLSYNVSVDTSSLADQHGYLYFAYIPVNAANSTATVSNFSGGALDGSPSVAVNGSAVTGTLPGTVTFANTNGINDYNHGILFGNAMNFGTAINFQLSFSDPVPGGPAGGSSTFSLGLYSDANGSTPLLTSDGVLFNVSLMNNGTATTQVLANEVAVNPTPIPAAVYLFGSGLLGLVGIRRKTQSLA